MEVVGLEKEHYQAMKQFFSEGTYAEAWKKFEAALQKKTDKESTPKKIKAGSHEAPCIERIYSEGSCEHSAQVRM